MTERVLGLILTGLREERFKTGPHSAQNMSLDLTLEDSTDMLSGGKFKLRHGVLESLTPHWKRRYGPTLSL